MCGVSGFLTDAQYSGPEDTKRIIADMTSVMHHRGPDHHGIWVDGNITIAMGHQRLAVIDLSPAGEQPMHSSCGRYCISYNGEIYNTGELRNNLSRQGKILRGCSDTEVILESCAVYGVDKIVRKLVGMFAFALWDKQERTLCLVRDRLGIKPLYWGRFGGLFLFASELKSLREHPGWRVTLDRVALADFMRYGYIPAPRTIYEGISKLQPGTILKFKQGHDPGIDHYWNLGEIVTKGLQGRRAQSEPDILKTTEAVLEEAVRSRMIADVSLGAFLSGGVDSTVVSALMQKNSMRPVRTFSIGFHEQGYDEAGYARNVARHLGTEHTEFYVSSEEARHVIPMLPDIYDEPFADSSQIPTYLLSKLTRQHVTVALSGDGGDEVFAGYNRYYLAGNLLGKIEYLTRPGQLLLKHCIQGLSPSTWSGLAGYLPGKFYYPQAGDKLYKLANILPVDRTSIYRKLIGHWDNTAELVLGPAVEPAMNAEDSFVSRMDTLVEQMQYRDLAGYLPDDILTKVDRASMAVSLEVRVPLLDHRLVEHAWTLPLSSKLRNGQGKWLLRQILDRYVPRELIDRPKMGFAVPLETWLRGELRDWAESLINDSILQSQGCLNAGIIREKWKQHQSGERNWHHHLWNVLMFQAWYARWMQA